MNRRTLLRTAGFIPALGLVGILATGSALAQSAPAGQRLLKVSTGGKSGTYYKLMTELATACPGMLEVAESDGSNTNIDLIMTNKLALGVTQFDVLYFRGQKETDLKKRIRILAVLHPEEVHFIAKSAPRTEGGVSAFGRNMGGTSYTLNTIDDLKGRKVGVWGGAVVTEQVIAAMALTGWQVVELPNQAAAMSALQNDQIDVILAVGGQPLEWVEKLSREYKLLSVPDSAVTRLASVYDKTTLSYNNLGQNGVTALAVNAMLVTRNYETPEKRAQLKALRDCMVERVSVIRETEDTHPKWMVIEPTTEVDPSKWPMYLPTQK